MFYSNKFIIGRKFIICLILYRKFIYPFTFRPHRFFCTFKKSVDQLISRFLFVTSPFPIRTVISCILFIIRSIVIGANCIFYIVDALVCSKNAKLCIATAYCGKPQTIKSIPLIILHQIYCAYCIC